MEGNNQKPPLFIFASTTPGTANEEGLRVKFLLGCELGYRLTGPSTLIFNIQAARIDRHRIVRESLDVTPANVSIEPYTMPESGNRYARLRRIPEGTLTVRYDAEVELESHRQDPATIAEIPPGELPLAVLPHLYPSRYCPADMLRAWAAQEFGALEPGHGRVTAICNWIYEHLEYCRGSSDSRTSASDTLIARSGVCRDFAHLGVSFCRALDIPARFVSGYAWGLEPADFHAIFEAYLGDRWYLFDPTRQANLDGVVRIGVGRDAAEVSFATTFGAVEPTSMAVWIEPSADRAAADDRTVEAVSTAGVGP
jgi:transglutaminase-like putative cysteine protease